MSLGGPISRPRCGCSQNLEKTDRGEAEVRDQRRWIQRIGLSIYLTVFSIYSDQLWFREWAYLHYTRASWQEFPSQNGLVYTVAMVGVTTAIHNRTLAKSHNCFMYLYMKCPVGGVLWGRCDSWASLLVFCFGCWCTPHRYNFVRWLQRASTPWLNIHLRGSVMVKVLRPLPNGGAIYCTPPSCWISTGK